jgi:hypothetical protein
LGEGGGDEIRGGGWIYFITTDLGCIGDGNGETTTEENRGGSTKAMKTATTDRD